MSDERPFFTLTAKPNGTGMSGLLAEAKASEVKYKDRCKMHVLASPEVGWTPRRIGRYLKRHPRTVRRILEQPETPMKSQRGVATTIREYTEGYDWRSYSGGCEGSSYHL
jgi:hypothetical protein